MADKWVCCCGCHVTKCAYILAWLGLLFLLPVPALFLFVPTTVLQRILLGIYTILGLFTCLPIIFGHRMTKRPPSMYLPYLVVQAILIVLSLLSNVYVSLVKLHMTVPPDVVDEFYFYSLKWKYSQQNGSTQLAIIIGHFIGSIVSLFLALWFFSIVYRAYKFVKKFDGNKNTPI